MWEHTPSSSCLWFLCPNSVSRSRLSKVTAHELDHSPSSEERKNPSWINEMCWKKMFFVLSKKKMDETKIVFFPGEPHGWHLGRCWFGLPGTRHCPWGQEILGGERQEVRTPFVLGQACWVYMNLCGSGCFFWCFYIQEPHWFGVWECWDLEFPCLHPNSDEHFRLSTGTCFSGKVLQRRSIFLGDYFFYFGNYVFFLLLLPLLLLLSLLFLLLVFLLLVLLLLVLLLLLLMLLPLLLLLLLFLLLFLLLLLPLPLLLLLLLLLLP